MKKLISVLLCGSMVLSLAGCSKKTEETKRPKKPQKTTEETEETEAPTDDTEESDTSSEETGSSESETSAPANVFKAEESLEMIGMDYPTQYWDYTPVFDKSTETTAYMFLSIDELYLEDGTPYDKLEASLERDFAPLVGATEDQFKKDSEMFLNNAKSGNYTDGNTVELTTPIFRSDSQIFSAAVTGAPGMQEGEFRAFNYRTDDGSAITMDDVILDRGALNALLEQYFAMPGADNDYKDWLSSIENSVTNGTLPFTLTYDGINILMPNLGMINYDVYKIPVIGHEDIFNMEYFGKTPKYYTIYDDPNHCITWDVNGDGQMDTIKVESEYSEGTSEYGSDEVILKIEYNDFKLDSKSSEINIISYGLMYSMIMKTDDGFYLYCRMFAPDSFEDTYVFKIDGDKLTYVDVFTDFMSSRALINPESFEMFDVCDTLGSTFFTNEFSVIGNHGMPKKNYALWTSDEGPVTAKIDIPCSKVSDTDLSKEGDITIPAGSFVRPYLYDTDTRRLIVHIVDPDPEKSYLAELDFGVNDYVMTVNGKDVEDVFYSIMFWG
ncbi:MAG: hypothetical protein J6Y58_07480 [Clostridiales bacterium]|nr:hypothetical protein [Clostridiales bacterium]